MGTNPAYYAGDDLPVEFISWCLEADFCNKLSRLSGFDVC